MATSRRKFNETKKLVLELFEGSGQSFLSVEVANALGLNLTNACDVLWRLARRKLVDREQVKGKSRGRPAYSYSINSRGLARLQFYRANLFQPT